MDFRFDGQCQAIPGTMWENEDGALDRLEKKAVPRIKSRCENTPPDY